MKKNLILTLSVSLMSLSGMVFAQPYNASGTDYSRALAAQEKWSEDMANEFVSMPNSFACIISNSGGDVNANAEWTALIDEAACGLAEPDPQGATVYSSSAMKSSRANRNSAQEVTAWFNAQGGQRFVADVTLKQGADTLAPFGEWYFSFYNAGILNSGTWTSYTKDTSAMIGFVDIGPSGDDVSILVSEEGKEPNGLNFDHRELYAKVLFVEGSSDNTKFLGKSNNYQTVMATGAAAGPTTTSYVAGSTSATHYFRQALDSAGNASGAPVCFDRSQQFETVHESGLYDVTTGAKKTINGGFGFKLANGTRGYLGQWGAWIDSDTATFTPTNTSLAVTDDNDKSFTLKWAPGQLMQRSYVDDTLSNGDTFQDFWYDREESGSWESDHIATAVWDNSSSRFVFTKSSGGTINVSSSDRWIWMYSPVKREWVAWKTGTTIKLNSMSNVLFSSTFADATSTKFVSQQSTGMDHTKASSLPYSLSAFDGVSSMSELFNDAATATSQQTYHLTGSSPGGSFEPNTLYLEADSSGTLSAGDKPIRFDFSINDKQTQTTNYSDGATASYSEDSAKDPFGRIDLYLASEASGANPTEYVWEFSAPNWAHSTKAYDSSGAAVTLDDPIRFIYTYASADDRNNGMTINVVSKDSYNPLKGCAVSGGISTCTNVKASDYNGQKFQLEYDGQGVHGFPGMEVCTSADCSTGKYFMKLVNLKDGTKLTDTEGNQYAFLGHAIASTFKEAAGGAADCSAIAFTDLASLGIAASDLPTTINRSSTDYPLPSSVWTDAPTTSKCTVTMGDTSGC